MLVRQSAYRSQEMMILSFPAEIQLKSEPRMSEACSLRETKEMI